MLPRSDVLQLMSTSHLDTLANVEATPAIVAVCRLIIFNEKCQ